MKKFQKLVVLSFTAILVLQIFYDSGHFIFPPENLENRTSVESLESLSEELDNYKPSFSIVIQLSGEMGNNLAHFAHGHALYLWLKRQYGVNDTNIILRHQVHPKWKAGRKALQQCFPNTRSFDFAAGNTPEFEQRRDEQTTVFGGPDPFAGVSSSEKAVVESALRKFIKLKSNKRSRPAETIGNISLPFLYSKAFVTANFWVDLYYDDLRHFLRFDPACCRLKPDPDEAVFHFRNFVHEMPKRGYKLGFEELDANKTAEELFGHLEPGEKVAITTRFPSSPGLMPYLDAFKRRGIQARVINQTSGTEDFCFLMNTQKELVGVRKSTFFMWAAILSNCTNVRAYAVDSPAVRRNQGIPISQPISQPNLTNPKLVSRVRFELYKA